MGKGYIVTGSNYTLKKAHKSTSEGTIYERDYMATTNLGGWDSGSIPISENGFKMVHRDKTNKTRSHNFGDFIQTPNGSDGWTIKDGAVKTEVTSESEIRLNTGKDSLLNYAYYGSCTELIKASIRDIISKFPAEIRLTNETRLGLGSDGFKYVVDNPFDIDVLTSPWALDGSSVTNPLRYLQLSYARYIVFLGEVNIGCLDGCETTRNLNFCGVWNNNDWDYEVSLKYGDESVSIRRYYNNGIAYYLSDSNLQISFRPGMADYNEFYNSLDDFERLLLSKDNEPIYTAILDFPHETERGIETYKKAFTWPTVNDWNLDIESTKYEEYVSDLLELADFYDRYYTNNLYRMMVHDSVKNMDVSFKRPESDETEEDYQFGATKLQGLLWAYGRQFDDLKRYAETISNVNTITYDGNNNIPDYFLTDSLELSGWEISSAISNIDRNQKTSDLYGGSKKEVGVEEASVSFLKNLKLNSKTILSRKGTRYGIELILGLFGLRSTGNCKNAEGDYKIEEFVQVVNGFSGETVEQRRGAENKSITYHAKSDELTGIEELNSLKTTLDTDTPDGTEPDALEGLPAILLYYKYKDDEYKVVVPWFKGVEEIDGNPYFQMYGGWGKIEDKYSETINYIRIVRRIEDLATIEEKDLYRSESVGDLFYVNDITDFADYFSGEPETNYFILHKGDDETVIGTAEIEKEDGSGTETITGWTPISKGQEVVKTLSEIVDEYRGNNPHIGYGNYDDGKEYLSLYEPTASGGGLFKYAIETKEESFSDEAFDCETGELLPEIFNAGFELREEEDSKKCWYFYDKERYDVTNAQGLLELESPDGINYTAKEMLYVEDDYCREYYGKDVRSTSGGTDEKNTIYAEYSIINTKKIVITFFCKGDSSEYYNEERYIKETIMSYLMQMIPSTAILEIKIEYKSE